MNSLVSIGIPTFNRAEFLKDSLSAALSQSYTNIEVIVSDNASIDHTEDVVRSFNDPRIRYYRNSENKGGAFNFTRCFELSNGEFFSWLQDDDVIFHNFVTDAKSVLDDTQCDFYFASCIYGVSISNFQWAQVYAPPIDLDWIVGKPTIIDPAIAVPMSLFATLGMSPVALFRKSSLQPFMSMLIDSSIPLFAERWFFARLASKNRVVIDPRISGVFRKHQGQFHKALEQDRADERRQLIEAARRIGQIAEEQNLTLNAFQHICEKMTLSTCNHFLERYVGMDEFPPFLAQALHFVKSRAETLRNESLVQAASKIQKHDSFAKRFVRGITPPILYKAAKSILEPKHF